MVHSKLYRPAAVSAALMLAASCADAPTVATPLEHIEAVASKRAHAVRADLVKRAVAFKEDVSRSASITPDGGVLWFEEAGLLLYFPRGAVSQPTTVTATALKGSPVVYDFQPHGLTFGTEIYVGQFLAATELNSPRTLKKRTQLWGGYLANGTADILPDGSAHFAEVFNAFLQGTGSDLVAVFTTTHFSQYAMASGLRGTPMLPGNAE